MREFFKNSLNQTVKVALVKFGITRFNYEKFENSLSYCFLGGFIFGLCLPFVSYFKLIIVVSFGIVFFVKYLKTSQTQMMPFSVFSACFAIPFVIFSTVMEICENRFSFLGIGLSALVLSLSCISILSYYQVNISSTYSYFFGHPPNNSSIAASDVLQKSSTIANEILDLPSSSHSEMVGVNEKAVSTSVSTSVETAGSVSVSTSVLTSVLTSVEKSAEPSFSYSESKRILFSVVLGAVLYSAAPLLTFNLFADDQKVCIRKDLRDTYFHKSYYETLFKEFSIDPSLADIDTDSFFEEEPVTLVDLSNYKQLDYLDLKTLACFSETTQNFVNNIYFLNNDDQNLLFDLVTPILKENTVIDIGTSSFLDMKNILFTKATLLETYLALLAEEISNQRGLTKIEEIKLLEIAEATGMPLIEKQTLEVMRELVSELEPGDDSKENKTFLRVLYLADKYKLGTEKIV